MVIFSLGGRNHAPGKGRAGRSGRGGRGGRGTGRKGLNDQHRLSLHQARAFAVVGLATLAQTALNNLASMPMHEGGGLRPCSCYNLHARWIFALTSRLHLRVQGA